MPEKVKKCEQTKDTYRNDIAEIKLLLGLMMRDISKIARIEGIRAGLDE